jgi:hypothetical protein
MTNLRVKKILIDASIGDMLDAYCEDVETIPTDKAKAFFHDWTDQYHSKLIRQCIFAGVFWAHSHPETVTIEETDDQN